MRYTYTYLKEVEGKIAGEKERLLISDNNGYRYRRQQRKVMSMN